jgi:hypothetical protein
MACRDHIRHIEGGHHFARNPSCLGEVPALAGLPTTSASHQPAASYIPIRQSVASDFRESRIGISIPRPTSAQSCFNQPRRQGPLASRAPLSDEEQRVTGRGTACVNQAVRQQGRPPPC